MQLMTISRKAGNENYVPTTWQISFDLKNVSKGDYTLRIALATAHNADLQVRITNFLETYILN